MNYCYAKLKLLLVFCLLILVDNLFGQQGQENYGLENYMYEVNVTPNWCGPDGVLGSIEVIVPNNNPLNYRWADVSDTDLVRSGLLSGSYYLVGEDPLINVKVEGNTEECYKTGNEEIIKIEVPIGFCSYQPVVTDIWGNEGIKYCKKIDIFYFINGVEVNTSIVDIEWEILREFGTTTNIIIENDSEVYLQAGDVVTLNLSYTDESISNDPQPIPCCSFTWAFSVNRRCQLVPFNGSIDNPDFNTDIVQSINAFPNPFSNKLITEVNTDYEGEGQLVIYDKFQRQVFSESRFMDQGKNVFEFNFQGEKAGVYYVYVRFPNGSTETEKVVLIK